MIFSRHVPVCTDLLTIGPDTVIRKESFFSCYRAYAGWIQTGRVTIGRNVFIGEKTVLDINTSMGDVSQLGHASSLHSGQRCRTGERWHGSPAQRTDARTTCGSRPGPAAGGAGSGSAPSPCSACSSCPCRCSRAACCLLHRGSARWARCWTPACGAITTLGALPRRAGHLAGAVLRLGAARPAVVATVPRAAQPVHQAERGLPAVRVPRPGPPGDRPDDRREVLHPPVRGQLLHRRLPALARVRPGRGRADRVELRHRGRPREPVPEHHRQRDDGRRRAVDHERRLLEPRRSGSPGVRSGRTTSSGTTSPTRRAAGSATTACSRPRR